LLTQSAVTLISFPSCLTLFHGHLSLSAYELPVTPATDGIASCESASRIFYDAI